MGCKGPLEHGYGLFGPGLAAHENIKSRETPLGPGVHADVRLRQDSDTGYTAAGCEMVQMNVQKRRPTSLDALTQGGLHAIQVVQIPAPPKIQDEMNARKTDTIPLKEMVLGFAVRGDVVVPGPATLAGSVGG